MASDIRLEVVRCSQHGFYAVTIGDGNGGVRLTPGKCCGSWNKTVVSWKLDAEQAARLAEDVAGFVELASARPHPGGASRMSQNPVVDYTPDAMNNPHCPRCGAPATARMGDRPAREVAEFWDGNAHVWFVRLPIHAGDPASCRACLTTVSATAHLYHPDSDVGPWDAACPNCRHLHEAGEGCPAPARPHPGGGDRQ